MALITRYVNTGSTSGGDGTTNTTTGANRAYVSLNAAEAAEQTDLTSGGDQLEILCSGSSADTANTTFSTGWTTSATDFVTVKPHADDVNATGVYSTSLYRIETTGGYNRNIGNASPCNHFRVEGLQLKASGSQQSCVRLNGSGVSNAVGCVVKGVGSNQTRGINFGLAGGVFNVVNSVVFDVFQYGIYKGTYMSGGSGGTNVYSNTADGCGTGLREVSGHGGGSRAFNNLLTNNTTDYNVDGTITHDNNVTSDATGPDTGHTSKTITYTDAAGKDFSTSDSDVVGLGTDLSADSDYAFSDDIIGEARPAGAWDVGAYQVAAGGGSTLAADSGAYAYTGTSADLLKTSVLTASGGAYTYTGTDASLISGALLSADYGSYSYSGASVDLLKGSNLTASAGAYTYTGTAATLTFASAGSFTLAADAGGYTYTGTSAALVSDKILIASSGAYSYTGTTADLNFGFVLVASSGAYTYTGTVIDFSKASVLSASSGDYVYNGTTVNITFTPVAPDVPEAKGINSSGSFGNGIGFSASFGGGIGSKGSL